MPEWFARSLRPGGRLFLDVLSEEWLAVARKA
jgi:hypothetical protein